VLLDNKAALDEKLKISFEAPLGVWGETYEQAVPGLFTAGTSDESVHQKEKVSSKRGIEILHLRIKRKPMIVLIPTAQTEKNERYYRQKNWDDKRLQS